jgi:hypothetical protein
MVISAPEITAPEASVTVPESVAPTACAPAGIEVKMQSTIVSKVVAIIPAFPLQLQLVTPLLIINFLLFQIMEHPNANAFFIMTNRTPCLIFVAIPA